MTFTYRFGAFLLAPATRTLLRDGIATTLPPKALDLIVYLIERRDRAVGRDELIAAVWGKLDITDNALGQVILQARRALDDSGEGGQRIILTVPRFGYRWVAPVASDEKVYTGVEDPPLPTASPTGAIAPSTNAARRRRWIGFVAALTSVLCGIVAWFGTSLLNRAPIAAAPDSPTVLVVLPVIVDAPPASAWVRLGVMDLVAQRLRTAGQPVVPSDNIVGFLARFTDSRGVLDAQALAREVGARFVIDATARLDGERWRVVLQARGRADRGEGEDDDVIAAARSAADRLALALGLHPVNDGGAANSLDRLLQQVRAAILSEQLDAAHALLLEAGDDVRARPEVRFHLAEIDFRAGRLDEAERALVPLLAEDTAADVPALHARVLNTLANLAYQRNDPRQVEVYSEQALQWLTTHDDAEESGRALVGRASARVALHRYDAALADFAQARVAFATTGDRRALARVDAYIGLLDVNRDRPAEALPPLRDAVERLRAFDAVVEELHARVGIVMAELAMLDPAAALEQCARLDDLATRVSDPRRKHYAGLVCVDALLASGRISEASLRLRAIREQTRGADASLLHQSQVQLHRLAAELALPADFDSAGARARILLLSLRKPPAATVCRMFTSPTRSRPGAKFY